MRNDKRVLAAAAVTAGISALGVAASAEAGVPQGQVRVFVQIVGEQAAGGLDTAVEIYDNGVLDTADCDQFAEPATQDNDVFVNFTTGCALEAGTEYSIGLDPLPAGYESLVSCSQPFANEQIVDDGNSFSIEIGSITNCSVFLGANMAVLTKSVVVPSEDGPETPAVPGDFTLEVYDGDGGLHDSGSVALSPECDWLLGSTGVACFYTDLESGDYSFGEVPVPGYQGRVIGCASDSGPDERFADVANETVTVDPDPFGHWFICGIQNDYATGTITLTKTLINDDGGTAGMDDFTLELYDGEGTMIDSGVCAADGSCLEGTYPIGDYTVGESGPDGYTRTVTQQVVVPTEQLTEPEAQIELEPFEQVTVNVESDDIAATTTTLAPTTTALQTTTTAFDAGSVTLPPTGDDSSTNIALVAVGLLLLGGAGLLLSRR